MTRWRFKLPFGASVAVHTCFLAAVGLGAAGVLSSDPRADTSTPLSLSWELSAPAVFDVDIDEPVEEISEDFFREAEKVLVWEPDFEEPEIPVFADDLTELERKRTPDGEFKPLVSRPVELQRLPVENTALTKPTRRPRESDSKAATTIAAPPAVVAKKKPQVASASLPTPQKTEEPAAKVVLARPEGNEASLRRLRRLGARHRWRGRVVVRVRVSAEGSAISAVIATSSGSKRQDEATKKAVLSWAFRPAQRGQHTAPCTLDIPFEF
ncbi:MAG: TonB family protein [Planctomycetota bacterium]